MKNKNTALIIMSVIFLFCGITIAYCSEVTDRVPISNPLHFGLRAKSGDKEGEKYLIEKLNKYLELSIMAREGRGYVGGEEKKWHFVDSVDKALNLLGGLPLHLLIGDMFLCGTNECLKAAIGFFAKFQPRLDSMGRASRYQHGMLGPQSGPRSDMYIESPRDLIIKGFFRRYHPELPLLRAEYDSLRFNFGQIVRLPKPENALAREVIIVEYMERFLDWGNRTYGTNFKLESKLLFDWQPDHEIYAKWWYARRERLFNEREWIFMNESDGLKIYHSRDADGKDHYLVE